MMKSPGGGGMGKHVSMKHEAEMKTSPGGGGKGASGSSAKGGYHAHMDVGRGGNAAYKPQIAEHLKSA